MRAKMTSLSRSFEKPDVSEVGIVIREGKSDVTRQDYQESELLQLNELLPRCPLIIEHTVQ